MPNKSKVGSPLAATAEAAETLLTRSPQAGSYTNKSDFINLPDIC